MTSMTALSRPLAGVILALMLVSSACGGSAAPTAAPTAAPATPSPTPSGAAGSATSPAIAEPTPVPGSTGGPGTPGQGGGSEPGSPGNPGSGIPIPVDPGAGGAVPPDQQPTIVKPATGLTGVHPVPAVKLDAAVSGRDVAVRVAWWSGIEPCNALAGITVARDGNTFLLTVTEGSAAAPDTMCIEIAMYKAAVVDLGKLEPGTYKITAFGDPAPVEVTIAG
jgi:hypothetical protein